MATTTARPNNFVMRLIGAAALDTAIYEEVEADGTATGQALLNYFLRAMNCGAITEREAVDASGLSSAELRSRSFAQIMAGRRAAAG